MKDLIIIAVFIVVLFLATIFGGEIYEWSLR